MAKLSASDLPDRLPQSDEEMDALERGELDAVKESSSVFSVDDLRSIEGYNDAWRMAQEEYGDIVDANEEIGTGFELVNKDKDSLCGVPFLVIDMRFNKSDLGEFVSFVAVTEQGRKVIVNDGSEGIYKQLREWSNRRRRNGGLLVKGGLRRSDYKFEDSDGKLKPATTYYLNV